MPHTSLLLWLVKHRHCFASHSILHNRWHLPLLKLLVACVHANDTGATCNAVCYKQGWANARLHATLHTYERPSWLQQILINAHQCSVGVLDALAVVLGVSRDACVFTTAMLHTLLNLELPASEVSHQPVCFTLWQKPVF